MRVIDLENITDAMRDQTRFVLRCEEVFHDKISAAASAILSAYPKRPYVALTGPSGSGKTTTAMRLKAYLENLGVPVCLLSMDNFFLSLEDRPKELTDWESPLCVNWTELCRCMEALSSGETAQVPWYDFPNGRTGGFRPMQGSRDAIILVEGIHMLNPIIFDRIRDRATGIYVAPRTRIITGDDRIVRPEQIRVARRGQKQPIPVRKPVKRPAEYASVEELYINGFHLEQYKQHNYRPEDYYLEGLRRDPGDIRCNTSMGRLALKNGRFEDCVKYCDRAIERLCGRNEHPADTEAFYLKGVALGYLGDDDGAYDILYRAAWNYPHRSAAMFELACIDCRRGDYAAALEKLDESIGLNCGHTKAHNLKTAILRKLGAEGARQSAEAGVRDDLLDLFALIEYAHFADVTDQIAQFAAKPENMLDVARDYMKAGLYEDAADTLRLAEPTSPLVNYYLAYITKDTRYLEKAESLETGYCFPSNVEDIAVLRYAAETGAKAANAAYYLGCLFYDRFRYAEAADCFAQCTAKDPAHGPAWRNLALYWFDKAHDGEKALRCMEKALEYRPHDPRLLLEYEQLLKNTNASIETRLTVYDRYPELLKERDDCYLDKLTLLSQQGKYEEAIGMAARKHFHIYEGGEGKLTKQHAWMHVLYGMKLMQAGELEKAGTILENGIHMPKSYGEAKTFFNQEAHIYYILGLLLARRGEKEQERAAYEQAAVYKAAVSEISLFRALALEKLGRGEEAEAVLDEMLRTAQDRIDRKDMRSYYGVGSPSPMPFELDAEKQNLLEGNTLKAFALYGLGRYSEAEQCIRAAERLDPKHFAAYIYREITQSGLI